MDEALRRSAAHVLVDDVAAPLLDDGARHHLRRVLRLRDGAVVTVTDGAGSWRPCRLAPGGLEPDGDVGGDRRRPRPVTVAVAPPKGDRLEWLVQKCTEVGVARLVLVDAERSVVRWDPDRAAKQLDRLRRIAAEAAMQSRRVWLPEVVGPLPGRRRARRRGRRRARRSAGRRRATRASPSGPEGGWSAGRAGAAPPTASRSAPTCCASRPPPSSPPR